MEYKLLDTCLVCGSFRLGRFVDLGAQPLANSFTKEPKEHRAALLTASKCEDCSHCQLDIAFNPKEMFTDYKYVSGTTETLRKHFESLVKYTLKLVTPEARILDIGSNDGSLMQEFEKWYIPENIEGVDPAENLREITLEKGLNVRVDFWNEETPFKLGKDYHIITALNCLAHNPDPVGFLKGCYRALNQFGCIIFEFPWLKSTIDNLDLGQFYYEHYSYFSCRSFLALVEKIGGLYISDTMFFPDIHGGTIRFVLKKGFNPHCPQFGVFYTAEEQAMKEGIWNFQSRLNKLKEDLYKIIKEYGGRGQLVAYGASAKSSTLFNFLIDFIGKRIQIDEYIDFVVDDSPLKQGLFCPGSNLEIASPSQLTSDDYKPKSILITAHNFKDEICNRLRNAGHSGIKMISYTPEIVIEDL